MKHRRIRYGGPRQQPKRQLQRETPVEVLSLSLDGRGVARPEGKTLFVRDALPGEVVEVEIEKSGKRFDEGRAISVITPCTSRVEPACPYYTQCGGCDLQHLDPEHAIVLKQQELLTQLAKRAKIEPESVDAPLCGSEKFGYRRAARIGINQRDSGEFLMGFRRRGSNKLVDIEHCAVLTPKINMFIGALRHTLAQFERIKHITQVEIIEGSSGLEAELRATRNLSDELSRELASLAHAQEVNLSVRAKDLPTRTLNANPAATKLMINDAPLFKFELEFSASDFVQVNAEVNELMINRVLEWLQPKPEERVLDLFSGLGNFSLPLAKRVQQVTAVEGSATMVERSLENAAKNGCSNIQAFATDLSDPDTEAGWLADSYDLILLDPPRQGAAEIIQALKDHKPRALAYIACDPASLVRDAETLVNQGYRFSRLCVADMFPQTHHIESLALFERR